MAKNSEYMCGGCGHKTASAKGISGHTHEGCVNNGKYKLLRTRKSLKDRKGAGTFIEPEDPIDAKKLKIEQGEKAPPPAAPEPGGVVHHDDDQPAIPPAQAFAPTAPFPAPSIVPPIQSIAPDPNAPISMGQVVTLGTIADSVAAQAQRQMKPLTEEEVWLAAYTAAIKNSDLLPLEAAKMTVKDFNIRFRA